MPLSKENEPYRGKGNPFPDWWDRGDARWQAERRLRWPAVSRALRRNIDRAGAQMADFRSYYLTGTPCEGLRGYIPIDMRLAMIPFETVDEARRAIEAYLPRPERGLRELQSSILLGASIRNEGLPIERFDDEGIRRLVLLGEAGFPKAFTAADAESSEKTDPAYFQEHGRGNSAKPLPFLCKYQGTSAWFCRFKAKRDGKRRLLNPSELVREYYLSCLHYLEATRRPFDPEGTGEFQRSLTHFLTEILFFDVLNPELSTENAVAHFARSWRARLNDTDLPTVIATERDRLLADPPELRQRPAPLPENPFAHLEFYGDSRTEYVNRYSPDADSVVRAIARFSQADQRDTVARRIGEPGRPADRSALPETEQGVFDAVVQLPLPYRVRNVDDNGLYLEFVDWHYDHTTVQPLTEALSAFHPELAFVTFSMIEEDGGSGSFKIQGDRVERIRGSSDSLFERLQHLAAED